MIDINPYSREATVDLSELCGWGGGACAAAGAASLADSPIIPDEIPAAALCVASGTICFGDFVLDTYGDDLCDNPSFAVFTAPWWLPEPAPQVVFVPRC